VLGKKITRQEQKVINRSNKRKKIKVQIQLGKNENPQNQKPGSKFKDPAWSTPQYQ